MSDEWTDRWATPTKQAGIRCPATYPDNPATQCVRHIGHHREHRYTSPADGATILWENVDDDLPWLKGDK